MDSHVRSVHDQYAQDPLQHPGDIGGHDGEHHEKKSVLKKVKAKAKKIKDTIASKAHGHSHDEHGNEHHEDEDEEYEEDEEVVQDPEVHGAPMYESAAASTGAGALKTPFDQKPDQHVTFDQKPDHRAFGAPTPPSSVAGHTAQSGQLKPSLGEHLREDLSAPKHDTPANYQTKATDPGAVGGEEVGATHVLHKLDRMHIHDEPQQKTESVPESFHAEGHPQDMNVDAPASQPQQGGGYMSSVTSAAVAAKNAVASKIGYGGNVNNQSAGMQTDQAVGSQTGQSAGTQTGQSAQPSSYTGKLSSATYAIADKAAAAKNVVASKLGYGGSSEPHHTTPDQSEMNKGTEDHAKSGGGVGGYGQQIASKLAPVYGTIAGAGSAVVSKMPGMGTGSGSSTGTGTATGTGTGTGTGSGYFAEKLKPGEEDKALSDVITGAFGKRTVPREEQEKKGVGAAVSDAIHKRSSEEEDIKREDKPMGKVTESEQVAKRLGSSEEEKSGEVAHESKEGVVDKFKGAFTNWFGKGGEMNPSQMFNDSQTQSQSQGTGEQQQGVSREAGENLSHEGERKLQTN